MAVLLPEPNVNRLRLTLEVDYTLNGATLAELSDNLEHLVRIAVGDAQSYFLSPLLTGDSPAEVDQWDYSVEIVGESNES